MLGDGNLLQVVGVGNVTLKTSSGKESILTNVQFVPSLAHNLLSVGQLMASGYKVQFSDGECSVRDAKTNNLVARIQMKSHRLFPLEAEDVGLAQVAQGDRDLTKLWHRSGLH